MPAPLRWPVPVFHVAMRDFAEPSPDEAARLREEEEQVRRCIEQLTQKHRQVIHLRFYVDDSLEAIAAALGCSVGTVKSRLFHALEKLRRMKALQDRIEEKRKCGL